MSILEKHVCTNLNIQCLEILLDRQIHISCVHEYLRLEIQIEVIFKHVNIYLRFYFKINKVINFKTYLKVL